MKKQFLNVIPALLLVVSVIGMQSACNSNLTKSAESLKTNAKAYGKLIRWKAYQDATKYINLRDGGTVDINLELLNEIRVTRYEVSSLVLNETNDEAVVTAEISYYHERVNSVHNIRDQQLWWKDEESGSWYLDGQLPAFVR